MPGFVGKGRDPKMRENDEQILIELMRAAAMMHDMRSRGTATGDTEACEGRLRGAYKGLE